VSIELPLFSPVRTLLGLMAGVALLGAPLHAQNAPRAAAPAAAEKPKTGGEGEAAAEAGGEKPPQERPAEAGEPAAKEAKEETMTEDEQEAAAENAQEPAKEGEAGAAVKEGEAEAPAAVASPVAADPVRVYGWRENIQVDGIKGNLRAKLDTGALTSSIHAEEIELFERDSKKWVRFVFTVPGQENAPRTVVEAPLVRTVRIKEPGGGSSPREVVRLGFQIGERKMRADFSLNNRSNMLVPVLLGRSVLKDLGWVDSNRTDLAEQKIFR
jgi:hypothetical protein